MTIPTRRLAIVVVASTLALTGCARADDAATQPAPSAVASDTPSAADVPGSDGPVVAKVCAPEAPDCEDMVVAPSGELPSGKLPAGDAPPGDMPGDGSAGTCLVGATECADDLGGKPPGPPDDLAGLPVGPREGLVDVAPVPWEAVRPVDAAQTSLEVTWVSGNQACVGLDEILVEESDEAVTITVLSGRDPEVEVCDAAAVVVSSLVDLAAELGPRSILDGADR